MKNFKIEISIQLVETDASVQNDPQKNANGNFSMVIDENAAISIDQIENNVLRMNFPAIRDAISNHFTEISKKKPMKTVKKSEEAKS